MRGRILTTRSRPSSFLLQTRESFNASREDIHALMRKMLEVRNSVSARSSHSEELESQPISAELPRSEPLSSPGSRLLRQFH